MANHAGGRRSVVNPGTKFGRPPFEVTQFLRPRSAGAFLAPVFVCVKPDKNKFISMKPNSNLNHFHQLLIHTIPNPLDQYNLFWSYKNSPREPKLGYFDGRAPQFNSRVIPGTPAATVIGHMICTFLNFHCLTRVHHIGNACMFFVFYCSMVTVLLRTITKIKNIQNPKSI